MGVWGVPLSPVAVLARRQQSCIKSEGIAGPEIQLWGVLVSVGGTLAFGSAQNGCIVLRLPGCEHVLQSVAGATKLQLKQLLIGWLPDAGGLIS